MRKQLFFSIIIAVVINTNLCAQTIHWAQRAIGNQLDEGNGIAVDNNGNTYITGQYESATLEFGTVSITNNSASGDEDAFVAKFDPLGNCVWAKSIGDNDREYGSAIAVDISGNTFVTGYFESGSLTVGTHTLNNAGDRDAFVVKLDNSGNVLWAKSIGGTYDDECTGISCDAAGNAYIIGFTWSNTLSFGTTSITSHGDVDLFTAKYSPTGNVEWAQAIGGSGDDRGRAIKAEISGNHYITGGYESSSVSFGTTTLTNSNTYRDNLFVAKYDNTGTNLWAKSATSAAASTEGKGVSIDENANCYVGGTFDGTTAHFGTYTITNAKPGGSNAFIAKYSATGIEQWASNPVSGPEGNQTYCITTDNDGNSYISGWFTSPTVTFGSIVLNSDAYADNIFLARYNPTGQVTHAYVFKGSGFSGGYGNAICNDNNGNVFLTGYFEGANITFGTTTLINTGSYDVYWTRISVGATEIREPGTTAYFEVYPNPACGYFIIKTPLTDKSLDCILKIFNLLGEEILEMPLVNYTTRIETSEWQKGLYLLSVVNKKGITNSKLMVK